MNNKMIQRRILLICLLLLGASGIVFATKFRGTYEDQIAQPIVRQPGTGAATSTSTNEPSEPELSIYSDSYITGFEEDMLSIAYELKYKPDVIAFQSNGPKIAIREKKNNQISTITIFYNGAAGFTSTQHFWQEMKLCEDCKRINPTLDFGESKDLVMYSNGQKEWAVFEREPGFIVAEYYASSGEIKSVITSLNMAVGKTSERPIFQDIDVFFIDTNASDNQTCTSTVRLVRGVVKTPKIGTSALLELFAGPTPEEKKMGFVSMIPDDVWLYSLSIEQGLATVNVSKQINAVTNPCHMEGAIAQIQSTVKQFPGIEKVNVMVEGKDTGSFDTP